MNIEKQYFTISEVARKFGVSTSLIRFWESQFDEIKPRKNQHGNEAFILNQTWKLFIKFIF